MVRDNLDLVCIHLHVARLGLTARSKMWCRPHFIVRKEVEDGSQPAVKVVEGSSESICMPKKYKNSGQILW